MIEFSTPWYEMPAFDLAVSVLIGCILGFILKSLVDGLRAYMAERRFEALERFEEAVDDLAWRRTADFTDGLWDARFAQGNSRF